MATPVSFRVCSLKRSLQFNSSSLGPPSSVMGHKMEPECQIHQDNGGQGEQK